jgi:hypothetical protein
MGVDHRMKIGTSSPDVVDNDEPLNIIGANLVKEFGGIILTGTSWRWVYPPEYL